MFYIVSSNQKLINVLISDEVTQSGTGMYQCSSTGGQRLKFWGGRGCFTCLMHLPKRAFSLLQVALCALCVLSYEQTDAITPNIVGPKRLGVDR